MRNWLFVITIIIAIVIITYKPTVKTMSGKVLCVESNSLTIDCSKEIKPSFKPTEDIGYSCTIIIDANTIIQYEQQPASIQQIEQGKFVSIELQQPLEQSKQPTDVIAKQITIHDK